MHLSDAVAIPTIIGMGLANAAVQASNEVRHSRDLDRAQRWIDHLGLAAQYAQDDFDEVVAALHAARAEAASLRAALEASDAENLALTLDVRSLRAALSH